MNILRHVVSNPPIGATSLLGRTLISVFDFRTCTLPWSLVGHSISIGNGIALCLWRVGLALGPPGAGLLVISINVPDFLSDDWAVSKKNRSEDIFL